MRYSTVQDGGITLCNYSTHRALDRPARTARTRTRKRPKAPETHPETEAAAAALIRTAPERLSFDLLPDASIPRHGLLDYSLQVCSMTRPQYTTRAHDLAYLYILGHAPWDGLRVDLDHFSFTSSKSYGLMSSHHPLDLR